MKLKIIKCYKNFDPLYRFHYISAKYFFFMACLFITIYFSSFHVATLNSELSSSLFDLLFSYLEVKKLI